MNAIETIQRLDLRAATTSVTHRDEHVFVLLRSLLYSILIATAFGHLSDWKGRRLFSQMAGRTGELVEDEVLLGVGDAVAADVVATASELHQIALVLLQGLSLSLFSLKTF